MKPRPGPAPAVPTKTAPTTAPTKAATNTTPTTQQAPPASSPVSEPPRATLGLSKKPSSTSTKPATKESAAASGERVAEAFARGEVTLGTALGVTPQQKTKLKERAFQLLKDKRADQAMPLLEGLVGLDPFDVWALAALAGLKMDAGQLPLASSLLDRALQVDPDDATARGLRAEVRHQSGDAQGSADDMRALDAADPSTPAVIRARALVPAAPAATASAPPKTSPPKTSPPKTSPPKASPTKTTTTPTTTTTTTTANSPSTKAPPSTTTPRR